MSDDLLEYADPSTAVYSDLVAEASAMISSKGPDMRFVGDVALGPTFGPAETPNVVVQQAAAAATPKLNPWIVIIAIVLFVIFNSEE